MKHSTPALTLLLLFGTGCASTGDPSRPAVRFESCAEMHAAGWPRGVRSRWMGEHDFDRSDIAEGTTRRAGVTRHEHRAYVANEHLDTDNDGHACEVDSSAPAGT